MENTQTIKRAATRRVKFLDYAIDALSIDETLEWLREIIRDRQPVQHCVLNAYKIYLLKKDPELDQIVRECGMVHADGVSIVWAGRLLGMPYFPRVTGIDLMEHILNEADKNKYRLFFLGATQEVLDRTLDFVSRKYPHSIIAGSYHGYFTDEHDTTVVDRISGSDADVLFVALSSPRKEFWLAKNLSRLNVPFCMGVGGSFDVIAGKTKRAPQWIQNMGLEWLYRLLQEPRRLWKRYLIGNLFFLYLILLQLVKSFFKPSAN